MAKSIKTNFVFNLINTISGLLFPLITFPYASRIIMPEGIGQIQFYTSIINYIVLFTSIGIPLYGIREIARVRDNERDLARTTVEILSLNLLLNIFGYIAVFIICLAVDRISENIPLFLILSTSILLTSIGCSWFYSGIEDFKYITIRGLFIKILCVLYLFLVVKTKDDLLFYGLYTVIGSIGNNILNFTRLRKYIQFSSIRFRDLDILRHIKPAFSIFVFNLVTSIYLNLDKVMLGFIKSDEDVGYYTAATNLSHILLYAVISLGTVLLPRASNLVKNNQLDEFARLSNKAYHFVLLIALPIALGCICLSRPLIFLFCGEAFAPSILTLQIITPIIFFIGISNIIGMQVLYPLGKIKIVTICTCFGATANFICNLIFIPFYSQNGAALATVFAEFIVSLSLIIIGHKYIPFKIFNLSILRYTCSAILMFLSCSLVLNYLPSNLIQIIIIPILGAVIYIVILTLFKDAVVFELLNIIKSKIKIKMK